jgi:uncharacterized 2Fe-2S/4Fe-4S cluster protein (DUF4445 family)/predicted metal-binding protein
VNGWLIRVHRTDGTVQPVPVARGVGLLEAFRAAGVTGVFGPCGGRGTCGKCLVRVGADQPAAKPVLACHLTASDAAPHPVLEALDIWLDQASQLAIQAGFTGPARPPWQPPASAPAAGGEPARFGVAIDVGTTTVVAALVELDSGVTVGSVADRNDQGDWGADVIARITAATEGQLEALTGAIRQQLAAMVDYLLEQAGAAAGEIGGYAMAGNTVMLHLLDGLSPESIGQAPFQPLSLFGDTRPAASLGLPGQPGAQAYLLPAVAGYVGGDITGGLLACALDQPDGQVALLLDLGTNGEMALATPSGIVACAAAAGPAFEGANLECGQPAVAGAIDRVTAGAGQLRFTTIAGADPTGICGSGIVDALAAALDLGLVDETGYLRFVTEVAPHLAAYTTPAEVARLVLTPEVYLSQADVRQLQLAKGAIAAGLDVLLAEAGLQAADVARVYLAGGFGTHLRPRSMKTIGLLPPVLAGRVTAVGNAALEGAIRALTAPGRAALADLAGGVRYVELSSDARFTEAFMEQIGFAEPPYQDYDGAAGLASDLGFEAIAKLDAATLEAHPEVREWCAADKCHAFGKNWMCPPACGTLAQTTERLGRYRWGVLVQTVGRLEDQFDLEGMEAAERRHKQRFRQLVAGLAGSFPRQWPLGAGACSLCPQCTYPAQPCRLPGLAHASMEASGLIVSEVCERNGLPYYHGPLTLAFTSCILLD